MTGKAFPEEDAPHARVTAERDAHKVEKLTLLQVCTLPDADDRRHDRIVVTGPCLQAQGVVLGQRREMVDEVEVIEPVDRGQAAEIFAVELRVITKEAGDSDNINSH